MEPWEIKESSQETGTKSRPRVLKNRAVFFLAIVGSLLMLLEAPHAPLLLPLIIVFWIVAGMALLLKNATGGAFDLLDVLNLILGMSRGDKDALEETGVPEGAKKVYDVKDLPPEFAANPEVRKAFELAGAKGAWVKIAPHDPSSPPAIRKETVKIRVGIRRAGHVQFGTVEEMAKLPPELAANPSPEKLSEWVKSQGLMPSDPPDKDISAAPISPTGVFTFSSLMKWASLIVIAAALAIAAVSLWSLKSGSLPH